MGGGSQRREETGIADDTADAASMTANDTIDTADADDTYDTADEHAADDTADTDNILAAADTVFPVQAAAEAVWEL